MDARGKPRVWFKGEVKTPPFSAEARLEAGLLLRRLQRGEKLSLPMSRPMPSIGSGCHELRIIDENATWRIVVAVEADAIVAEGGPEQLQAQAQSVQGDLRVKR